MPVGEYATLLVLGLGCGLAIGFYFSFRHVAAHRAVAEALRASEAKLREQAELLSAAQRIGRIGSWSMELADNELTWSNAAGELFGFRPDEFDGGFAQFRSLVLAEDRVVLDAAYARAEAGDGAIEIEYRIRRADGEVRWMYERGNIQFDADAKPVRRRGMLLDITERKRTQLQLSQSNRALRLLTACNDALFRSDDEQLLLAEVCEAAVSVGGYSMAWIGYAADDAACSILPLASSGRSADFLAASLFSWDEHKPAGQNVAGRVIRSGVPVVIRDLANDAATTASDRASMEFGLRSVICLPLHDRDRTFGLLAMYGAGSLPAISNELPILQDLADNLAYGISAIRVRAEQQRLQLAVQKVASAVSADGGTAFFEHLVAEMTDAIGARAGFIVRPDPNQPGRALMLAGVVDGNAVRNGAFEIAGSPCAALTTHASHIEHAGAEGLFQSSADFPLRGARTFVGRRLDDSAGQTAGLMFLLFNDNIRPEGFVASALQIFAARAAAELERRDKDTDLRDNEVRLSAILDTAAEGIITIDEAGRIESTNPRAEAMFGYSATELLGRNVSTLMPTPHREQHDQYLKNFRDSGIPKIIGGTREMTGVRKDGSTFPVDLSVSEVRLAARRIFTGFVRDVSARRDADNALKRVLANLDASNRELQDFAFVASHDLQEPLRKIRAFSERLLQRSGDQLGAQGRDFLDRSINAATRMQSLIDDLLAYSRVAARGKPFAAVDMQAVTAAVLEDLDARIEATSARIDVGDLPLISGDATQLRQVMQNLLSNSLKYVAPERAPVITISATPEQAPQGQVWRLRISDNGIGFDPKYAERIFAPFQRLHSRQEYEGTGIGLAIVKRIVERHRGAVCASARVGEGTTIDVYLPEHHAAGSGEPLAASAVIAASATLDPQESPHVVASERRTDPDPDGGRRSG